MTHRRTRVLAAALALLLVPSVALADSHSVDDARQNLRQLEDRANQQRSEVADIADERSTVEEQLAAARAELDALQPKLDAASAALSDAEERADLATRKADMARVRAEQLNTRLEAAMVRLQENEDERGSVARNTYKHGPGIASPSMAMLQMVDTGNGMSPTDVADTIHMLDVLLIDHGMLVDESLELAEEAHQLAEEARQAHDEAEAEAEKAEEAKVEAAERHNEMLQLLAQSEAAVEAEQAAMAELASQEDNARSRLQELEEAKANAKTAVEKAEAEAARQAELKRQREAEARRQREAQARGGSGVPVRTVNGSLTQVGGITVASSIAEQVRALLKAAADDGIHLGGYGYRSPETTARLRQANGCPDVYDSPASACRVPTARPGSSMHEQGLAIDFSWNGSTICYPNPPSRCNGNRAFDWLQANASKYGLYGLSTEAWHWSTNGN